MHPYLDVQTTLVKPSSSPGRAALGPPNMEPIVMPKLGPAGHIAIRMGPKEVGRHYRNLSRQPSSLPQL